MADKEEQQETTPRGADWEVVSLTASAYAAAPGGNMPEFKHGEMGEVVDKEKVDTSNTLFMSGHFGLPPSQHENVPTEPENTEILNHQVGKDDSSESVILDHQVGKDDSSESVKDLHGKPDTKEEENWGFSKFTDVNFTENTTLSSLDLSGKEQSIYSSPTLHTLHSETTSDPLNIDDDSSVLAESIQSSDPAMGSNALNLPKQIKEDSHEESGAPYAAWLKKQAASFYAHAKETNTFWSIFAAATVMGIVIIGQQWQQERWQVLRLEWKSRIHDERIRMMAGPISRFKDAIVAGFRQDFSIRGSIEG